MFSILLILIQQILKDQGIDHTSKEFTSLITKVCKMMRKQKGNSVNVSSDSEYLTVLLSTLFKGDFSRNQELQKTSMLKRISRAAENLSNEDSVLRGDNEILLSVMRQESKEINSLSRSNIKTNITSQQIIKLMMNLGSKVRQNAKMFKYTDYTKGGLSAYTLKGLENIDYFEMVIDTFANSVQFHLPIDVTLVLDFNFGEDPRGKGTPKPIPDDKGNGGLSKSL